MTAATGEELHAAVGLPLIGLEAQRQTTISIDRLLWVDGRGLPNGRIVDAKRAAKSMGLARRAFAHRCCSRLKTIWGWSLASVVGIRSAYIYLRYVQSLPVIIAKNKSDLKKKEAAFKKNGILLPDKDAEIGPQSEASRSRLRAGQESEAFEAFTQRFRGTP